MGTKAAPTNLSRGHPGRGGGSDQPGGTDAGGAGGRGQRRPTSGWAGRRSTPRRAEARAKALGARGGIHFKRQRPRQACKPKAGKASATGRQANTKAREGEGTGCRSQGLALFATSY
eukprot:3596604-Pyramimonas_sp.AAC.1